MNQIFKSHQFFLENLQLFGLNFFIVPICWGHGPCKQQNKSKKLLPRALCFEFGTKSFESLNNIITFYLDFSSNFF